FPEPGKIRNEQIDADVVVWERRPAIDDQHLPPVFQSETVHPDLSESAERPKCDLTLEFGRRLGSLSWRTVREGHVWFASNFSLRAGYLARGPPEKSGKSSS